MLHNECPLSPHGHDIYIDILRYVLVRKLCMQGNRTAAGLESGVLAEYVVDYKKKACPLSNNPIVDAGDMHGNRYWYHRIYMP